MDIKAKVNKILHTRWDDLRNSKNLISMYYIEKQTNQGYNGRQLLELFQNCEDEGASKVKISLDTENCLLEISNDGNKPFSVEGYDSIFYPGLTSKVSSGYIGNKGLGFRSIINWADEISIISNGFKVIFNESFKKDILINELGYTEDDLNDIRRDRKLNKEVYPLPLLNSCKLVYLEFPNPYTTTIAVKYKKNYETDILKQINSITEKTLLFLRNINTIEIEGNIERNTISVTRNKLDENHTEINYRGETYYVLSDDGIVDEDLIDDQESSEPKRYSVKIAYNDNLTFSDNVLYNYFKTQIPFELPFVVHASLELDQNRNHSTESRVNPFILKKLFSLHLKMIQILKNKLQKSWLPYQTINNKDFEVYKPYSELIDNYWNGFEVYPTLSGKYESLGRAKNLGNRIAEFLEEYLLQKHFGEQTVYCDSNIFLKQAINRPANYVEIIEKIAKDLNIQQRAKFVKLLLENYPNEKFCVLIDEKDKLIKVEDYVYTDKTAENKNLEVPSYSNIRFLNPTFYQTLIQEFDLSSETHKSRSLKDKLENISDVHSFEPQTVIKKIISETDILLKKEGNDQQEIITEFYQKIFHNYKLRGENPELDYDSRIPCLNRLNQVKDIKDLVLSNEFEIGKISNEIFEKLYADEYVISNIEKLGLKNENFSKTEEFLKWLGINHFSIIDWKTSGIQNKFIDYIRREHNTDISSYYLFSIKNFEKIVVDQKININHIIGWLSLDEQLKKIFTNYTLTHSNNENLTYSYYGVKRIHSFKNFIFYSFSNQYDIENYLITNKRDEWFNPFKIEYEYLKNINPKLDKDEVDRILSFFGAKKDFNDLNINYLKKKTQELANRNKPKGAQVFYKNLVGHYKQNQQQILNIDLYAREGNNIVVKNADEIYYSDRIQLPELLTNDFPILYYPSRSGGTTAIEMFGLKNLNDLDLKVQKEKINESISDEFEKFISEIKPFILAYRLDKITKEDVKRDQVQMLNKLKIICYKELVCSIDGELFNIEPYNYVYSSNQFYLNIPDNSTLYELKNNKYLRDNLSDIFLKVFDTQNDKKTFESILIQSLDDNIYDINNELAEGILEEAKILLGQISIRLSIWKSIFKLKEIPEITDLTDNNLESYILEFYPNLKNEILFTSADNLKEIERIRNVFNTLSIDIVEYNTVSDYKLTFDKLVEKEFKDYFNESKKNLKNQLWVYLNDQKVDQQSKFVGYLYKIEHLLNGYSITRNSSSYDFENLILLELENVLPFIQFELSSSDFPSYDAIEKENVENFTEDELLLIRNDMLLNSLSYFEGHIEHIKSKVKVKTSEEDKTSTESVGFNLDKNKTSELIHEFDIEKFSDSPSSGISEDPWLGNSSELNSKQKKKLGIRAEEIVKKYLEDHPDLYDKVEHTSKTSEGEHFDIQYFDMKAEKFKYVECKYYNGNSFFLSYYEKRFADENIDQYEIWLVNKDSKIFCIKDIKKLGDLQPTNYKVNIKLKEYALPN